LNNKNLINAISGLLGFTIPILALVFTSPYIINHLGTESYGVINITSLLISYLLLLDCAYEVVLTPKIAANNALIGKLASDSLLVYITVGLVGIVFITLLGYPYAFYWVNIEDSHRLDLYLTMICTGFSFLSLMLFSWNRAISNGLGNYVSSNFFYVIFNLGGILIGVLVVYWGYDFLGYTFARSMVWVVMIPIYIIHLHKFVVKIKVKFSKDAFIDFTKNIKYGFWLRLSEQFLNRADQLLITVIFDLKVIAYFSACFIIYNANTLLVRKMIEFTLPKFAALVEQNNMTTLKYDFEKYFELTTALVLLVFGTTIFVGNDLIIVWLGADFALHANKIYFNMLVGGALSGISIILLSYFLIANNQYPQYSKYLTTRSFAYLILFVLLTIIFKLSIDTISILFILNGVVDFMYMVYTIKSFTTIKFDLLNLKFYLYTTSLLGLAILIYVYRSTLPLSYNFYNLVLMCAIYFSFYIFVSLMLNYPNRSTYLKLFKINH
jgi:O-antigen/teichoic acid export membrane protein